MTPFPCLRRWLRFVLLLVGCAGAAFGGTPALAGDNAVAGWKPLVERLAAEGLDTAMLERLFIVGHVAYEPGIMARKVDAMVRKTFEPRPAPSGKSLRRSAYRYLLRPEAIRGAVAFIAANRPAFDRAAREHGPPPELIASFLLVETKLGSYLGERDALGVLASLARSDTLESIEPFMKTLRGDPDRRSYAATAARDRAGWAYRELVALLRYAKANGQDPRSIPGSIYGAIGICQFMPTNALQFGVDGDNNGRTDLFTPADAIVSVASYLRGHGYKPNMTETEAKAVVYAYNHSQLYVLAVLTVADRIKEHLGGTR